MDPPLATGLLLVCLRIASIAGLQAKVIRRFSRRDALGKHQESSLADEFWLVYHLIVPLS